MTRVTVIVPCRNERDYIERCVEALMNQDYPAHLYTAVVCDGMSNDGTREILEQLKSKYSNLVVLDNPARVTPIALNMGARYNDDEVKIILGAHSEVYPDYVRANVEVLNEHPECNCCGGWFENVYSNEQAAAIGLAMSSPFGVGNAHYRTSFTEGYVDTAGFGAYRKEVFQKLGFFDEELVRNQDDELNYRITNAGMKIWLSHRIRCRYYVRGSFGKLSQQQFQYGYWKVYVNRKHKTITTWRQVIPAAFVAYLGSAVLFLLFTSISAWILLMPLMLYVIVAVVEAARLCTAAKKEMMQIPRVIYSFLVLHLSYGTGYLDGILSFIVMNKKPTDRSKSITR